MVRSLSSLHGISHYYDCLNILGFMFLSTQLAQKTSTLKLATSFGRFSRIYLARLLVANPHFHIWLARSPNRAEPWFGQKFSKTKGFWSNFCIEIIIKHGKTQLWMSIWPKNRSNLAHNQVPARAWHWQSGWGFQQLTTIRTF